MNEPKQQQQHQSRFSLLFLASVFFYIFFIFFIYFIYWVNFIFVFVFLAKYFKKLSYVVAHFKNQKSREIERFDNVR
jgi:hypothetical protein